MTQVEVATAVPVLEELEVSKVVDPLEEVVEGSVESGGEGGEGGEGDEEVDDAPYCWRCGEEFKSHRSVTIHMRSCVMNT